MISEEEKFFSQQNNSRRTKNAKERKMKRSLIITATICIMLFTIIATACAEEKAPKIARFIAIQGNYGGSFTSKLQQAESEAIRLAEEWLRKSYKNIKVISHSTACYHIGNNDAGHVSVTIMYTEK